jgi:hypothetical protein
MTWEEADTSIPSVQETLDSASPEGWSASRRRKLECFYN